LIFLFGALVASILVKETYPKNQVAAQALLLT
jgi:hypothetical protein